MLYNNKIHIPYFVTFDDGMKVATYMESNPIKSVYLKVDMSLSKPDNRVEYELWYSSILDLSKSGIKTLCRYDAV